MHKPGWATLTLHRPPPPPPFQIERKPTTGGGVCQVAGCEFVVTRAGCEFVVTRWKVNPDHLTMLMRDGAKKPFEDCPGLHVSMACRIVVKADKDAGAREFMLTVVEAAEVREDRRLPKARTAPHA